MLSAGDCCDGPFSRRSQPGCETAKLAYNMHNSPPLPPSIPQSRGRYPQQTGEYLQSCPDGVKKMFFLPPLVKMYTFSILRFGTSCSVFRRFLHRFGYSVFGRYPERVWRLLFSVYMSNPSVFGGYPQRVTSLSAT